MVLLPSLQAVFPVSTCISCSLSLYTTYSMENSGKYGVWRVHDTFQYPAGAAASKT